MTKSAIGNVSVTNGSTYYTTLPSTSYSLSDLDIDWNNISITASSSSYGYNGWATSGSAGIEVSQGDLKMNEGADIKFGDKSLKETLDKIEQRLAILQPNKELEKEWEELKELGDRYRELENEIKEKMKVWNILKK